MRALFDANVLISALFSRTGAPAQLLGKWLEGEFELVVTNHLLEELSSTLARPKFRRVPADVVGAFLELLRAGPAELIDDPERPPSVRSRDTDDDYLIAAAASAHATLVTGDAHLLELADEIPVMSPRDFLNSLG